MKNVTETGFIWTDDIAHFSSSQTKWINHVKRLAGERPEDVRILYLPETNGGYLTADIPVSWVKISPPRKMNLTILQRIERSKRLEIARSMKGNAKPERAK